MPIKSEVMKLKLPPGLDRRRKLTQEDRESIRLSTDSTRSIARLYQVSRRTVQFIKDPGAKARNIEALKARGGWRNYYTPEKHRDAMARTRAHRDANLASLTP